MRAFLYILKSSPDPDEVERSVPFHIDEEEVFFGPCKKRLRAELRKLLLAEDREEGTPGEELYLIGFNGASRKAKHKRKRKVVWAGRIKRAMTFARAWDELADPRFDVLRSRPKKGPLHVKPIRGKDGRLIGYRHVTELHAGKWIKDLTARKKPGLYRVENETEIRLADGVTPWKVFTRDVCFLLENVFRAGGAGIAVDDEILEILRQAQPGQRGIDRYAVFGRQNKKVDGKRGGWLEIQGDLAGRLIAAIKHRARELEPEQKPLGTFEIRACDDC